MLSESETAGVRAHENTTRGKEKERETKLKRHREHTKKINDVRERDGDTSTVGGKKKKKKKNDDERETEEDDNYLEEMWPVGELRLHSIAILD